MFPLSITVRPNHQGLCAPGLLLQVLLYVFLVCRNSDLDGCIKETERIATVPRLEHRTEVLIHEMTCNRGDGILGPSLGVIKIIILDELAGGVALKEFESTQRAVDVCPAHRSGSTTGKNLRDRFGYGWFLSHA